MSFDLFDVVKSPSGGATVFSVPGLAGEEAEKELTGILLDYTTPRAYWNTSDPVEGTPPVCMSHILYRLGATQSETREIWRSTEIAKGVADASWYITNGHLYYYFSGSDLWDIDLGTSKAEKMIALADTVKSVTALFTDSYFILLDDQPDSFWGPQSGWCESGTNLTIYDYSGNLLGERGTRSATWTASPCRT